MTKALRVLAILVGSLVVHLVAGACGNASAEPEVAVEKCTEGLQIKHSFPGRTTQELAMVHVILTNGPKGFSVQKTATIRGEEVSVGETCGDFTTATFLLP